MYFICFIKNYLLLFFLLQNGRPLSKNSNGSQGKKSPTESAASSPDITSRGPLILHNNNSISSNNNINNNNNNNLTNSNGNVPIAAMSETSDDSSLNSDLDPMGKFLIYFFSKWFCCLAHPFRIIVMVVMHVTENTFSKETIF